jgi:hypothetical protein
MHVHMNLVKKHVTQAPSLNACVKCEHTTRSSFIHLLEQQTECSWLRHQAMSGALSTVRDAQLQPPPPALLLLLLLLLAASVPRISPIYVRHLRNMQLQTSSMLCTVTADN